MKKNLVLPAICLLLFIILIFCVKCVDVAPISAGDMPIGLSKINAAFRDLIGNNFALYRFSNYLGVLAISMGSIYAVMGAYQLIKRKNLLKVDPEILTLGGLYIILGATYFLFEKVVINYRPFLVPPSEVPEASFPSSHTMLACVVLFSIVLTIGRYVSNKPLKNAICIFCTLLAVAFVVCRIISGVHWLTDIVGGLLMSGFLLGVFSVVLNIVTKSNK